MLGGRNVLGNSGEYAKASTRTDGGVQSNGGSCSKDAVSIPLATSGKIPIRT